MKLEDIEKLDIMLSDLRRHSKMAERFSQIGNNDEAPWREFAANAVHKQILTRVQELVGNARKENAE